MNFITKDDIALLKELFRGLGYEEVSDELTGLKYFVFPDLKDDKLPYPTSSFSDESEREFVIVVSDKVPGELRGYFAYQEYFTNIENDGGLPYSDALRKAFEKVLPEDRRDYIAFHRSVIEDMLNGSHNQRGYDREEADDFREGLNALEELAKERL